MAFVICVSFIKSQSNQQINLTFIAVFYLVSKLFSLDELWNEFYGQIRWLLERFANFAILKCSVANQYVSKGEYSNLNQA